MNIEQLKRTMVVEYIWIGGAGELRSKTRVLQRVNGLSLEDIPDWDYDGSSTGQAEGSDSEVILKPCFGCRDPHRTSSDILVLCATYRPDGTPLSNNHRDWAVATFNRNLSQKPWFGLEQEYFILNKDVRHLETQGQFYCSVGTNNAYYRSVAELHMRACIDAGLTISGINAEVAPAQWEFQIGPCEGITAGDQMYIARYLLEHVSEKHGLIISYEPKALGQSYNGSGCHVNFSTKVMREPGGLKHIYLAIDALKNKHHEHMTVYGEGNRQRLTGIHETSSYETFSSGLADRGASIRIGNKTIRDGYGYFEDRRPAANIDPYLVTAKIFETKLPKI